MITTRLHRQHAPTSRRRTLGAGAAVLLLVPLLAACGFGVQTDQVYQAATGTNARGGQVDVLNALVVSAKDGEGTFAGTLVNTSDTQGAQLQSLTDAQLSSPVLVPPGQVVNLAKTGQVRLQADDLVAGKIVNLTFTFSDGQTVNLLVPVVANRDVYANVPVGSPSARATPSDRPVVKNRGPAKPSGSASPTSSPTASPSAG